MKKLIKLIKERLDIATKRNFKTIHITITPEEAKELIRVLEESIKEAINGSNSTINNNRNNRG